MTDRFFTRFQLPTDPQTDGPEAYTVIIRGEDDPERETRTQMRARGKAGVKSVVELNAIKRSDTPELWADRIVEHLVDGEPRTFNRIGIELVGKNADALMMSNPQYGLALALLDGRLSCTIAAPILFRTRQAEDVDITAAEAAPEPPMDLADTQGDDDDDDDEPESIAVDLGELENELLDIADEHNGVALVWCDDGEIEGITVSPRGADACATVWADGLVQLHNDGDLDSEPTDHRFTSAKALWALITKET